MTDSPAPSSAPGDLDFSRGDGKILDHSFVKAGPPQRPPPPQANTAIPSPAHSTTSNASKVSAFDDLNESIRMALGSPAKQITGGGVTGNVMGVPSLMQQQHLQQMSSSGFASPQHQMYSSPAKQQSGVGGGLCCSLMYLFSFFFFFFFLLKF